MTPYTLLEALKDFIQNETKDLVLPVRVERGRTGPKERPPEIHLMRLPNKEAQTKQIPYILIQFIKSEDDQQPGEDVQSKYWVRIIAAAYAENESDGALSVMNVLTRIRIALLRAGIIGKQFILRPPLESIIYPDSTPPYYLGEMISVWRVPGIESEVENLWH